MSYLIGLIEDCKLRFGPTRVFGIALVAVSILFFYLSSQYNWSYERVNNEQVHLTRISGHDWGYGFVNEYQSEPSMIYLRPDDHLSIEVDGVGGVNGSLYVVIWKEGVATPLLYRSAFDYNSYIRNDHRGWLHIYLASPNWQDTTITVKTTHIWSGTPHWYWFGLGVAIVFSGLFLSWYEVQHHKKRQRLQRTTSLKHFRIGN